MAWLRLLTNLTIIVPADLWQTEQAIRAAAIDSPVLVRVSRMPVPALQRAEARFEVGKAETLGRVDKVPDPQPD
jgi:transketolase